MRIPVVGTDKGTVTMQRLTDVTIIYTWRRHHDQTSVGLCSLSDFQARYKGTGTKIYVTDKVIDKYQEELTTLASKFKFPDRLK